MTSRADVVGSARGGVTKGASGQEIALRLYRAVILLSVALILLDLI